MEQKNGAKADASPAQFIDARIPELGHWRGEACPRRVLAGSVCSSLRHKEYSTTV